MKKVLFFIFLLWQVGCTSDSKPPASQSANKSHRDFTIVPGERVGMITGNTTEAELQDTYGVENLDIQSIPIAEGNTQEGVVLFPDTRNEMEIIWESAASEGKPAFVRIGKDSTEWKTEDGVTVGTSLEKLEEINGKPFTFYGFEWDYGGLVTDWNGGNLTNDLVIALVPQDFSKLTKDMLGEVKLSSDDPKVRDIKAKVASMVITFRQNPVPKE